MKTRKLNVVMTEQQPREKFTADKALDFIKRRASQILESYKNDFAKFSERFAERPADALEWSDSIFNKAADHEAASGILAMISRQEEKDMYELPSPRKILEIVQDYLFEEMLHRTKYPEMSTSQPSNLMSIRRNAARAEWFAKIKETLERIEA